MIRSREERFECLIYRIFLEEKKQVHEQRQLDLNRVKTEWINDLGRILYEIKGLVDQSQNEGLM